MDTEIDNDQEQLHAAEREGQQEEANHEGNEAEARARRMGWRPKDEYNGPESRWVDAETFIQRGEQELPIVRERLRTLDNRFAATERELVAAKSTINEVNTRVKDQADVITELRNLSKTAEERAYKQAMRDFSERERKAVAEADTVEYDRIQMEKRDLESTRPREPERKPVQTATAETTQTTTAAPTITPSDQAEISQWIAANPWYQTDPEMQAVAISIHGVKRQQNPNQPISENLAEVKERIVRMFPEKFENTRRRAPAAVTTSSPPPTRPKGKTIADLPAEAKAALAKFKKLMPDYKDEEYLKMYFGNEGA